MASRNVASGEMNSVLEIPYPRDEDRRQDPAPLEVRKAPGPPRQQRPHPPPHGLTLESQEAADIASRMREILAKARPQNGPAICSLHSSTISRLFCSSQTPAVLAGQVFSYSFYQGGKLRPRARTHCQGCTAANSEQLSFDPRPPASLPALSRSLPSPPPPVPEGGPGPLGALLGIT